ncbi:MAG: pyridoxal phosphate-dependent aminotransferase [Methanotrichaceae archaeon]|nr:pyridoxal phosphate-dependent aminotransferase [Methanotrichaceae archaeon]
MRYSQHIQDLQHSGIRRSFDGTMSDVINMGIGQPDFDTPDHIKNAAVEAIEEGFTTYTPNCGMPELREALARKFLTENGVEYAPQEILVTSGASQALFLVFAGIINKGEEILIGDPSFLSYPQLIKLFGGRPVRVPLNEDLNLTAEAISERITPHTRAIVVNSPGNPTGAVQSERELREMAQLAEDHGIMLISDEVYEHFIYEGKHVSPARFSDHVITVNAVSKTYAMTGWRVGYLAVKGEAVEDQFIKVQQYAQACACSISQRAALAAITGPQDCVRAMRDEFRTRRDLLLNGLREMDVEFSEPKGAFYVFPRVGDGERAAARLAEAGVIVVPGSAFGPSGRDFIRISYAVSREKIIEALERMRGIL